MNVVCCSRDWRFKALLRLSIVNAEERGTHHAHAMSQSVLQWTEREKKQYLEDSVQLVGWLVVLGLIAL